jgi:ubiquinone/menaquinone biosynthesis C-methylase UbiE
MSDHENYIEINKAMWNKKTAWHVGSAFYDMKSFREGKNTLNAPELKLLGNVKGRSILHLQCHFGQDSISLSRMGADVTGIDLSDKAIGEALSLASELETDTKFVCCNIYDLPQHLDKEFDIVFTSYGTIGWLPDLDKWASIVHRYLKPGGQFIFAEFHPVVWMFDNDFTKVAYRYFKSDPIIETENGTYADKDAAIQTTSITWNHGIAEVLTSLLQQGLQMNTFEEFDYSPYNCFNNTIEFEPGKFRIKPLQDLIPVMYTLSAAKESKRFF